jgi:hypothetical protein
MMKILTVLIAIVTSVLFSEAAQAQTYRTALGLRVGSEFGFTVQQKLWDNGTIEGILTSNKDRWQSQAIVEYHRAIIGRRINSYFGVGPHYGEVKSGGSYAGVTPIFGFEVTMFGLNFSYDYKPSLNVFHGENFLYHDHGLSVRVILLQQKHNRLLDRI